MELKNILNDLKLQYKTGGVTQRFIFWNIGVFIVSLFFFYRFSQGVFNFPNALALSSDFGTFIKAPWTLFAYMFLHASFLHLVFNMMVLNFIGKLFATYFTEKQLVGVYLLGGIFSGVIFLLSFLFLSNTAQLVGASGAITALLVATAAYAPYMLLRIPLIGVVKLWQIVGVLLLLDVIQMPLNNTGGHIAHLGGALFGYLFVFLLKKGIDISVSISKLQFLFEGIIGKMKGSKSKTPFKKVYKNEEKAGFSEAKDIVNQQKIDAILDKIKDSGYDALSKSEKEYLFKANK